MKINVGGWDRKARIALGVVMLAMTATGTIGAWGWLGLVPLATGLTRFCPLYPMLGFSSCPLNEGK